MDIVLQVWGGGFYLLNKIFFAFSETKIAEENRRLKMFAWSAFIIGVPAWLIILVGQNNWIAASVEVGGVPAMLLGLYNTYHNSQKPSRLFNKSVTVCTYSSLVFGLVYSLQYHMGITSLTQILEMGVMLGFLFGSYLMAKNNPRGWLFFMLMNLSMASLMFLQGKVILMLQQLLSLCFVIYGFKKSSNPVSKKASTKLNRTS